jgi:hypothetical protein
MSMCALCAQPTTGRNGVCAFHFHYDRDDWATANRTMCDFVHRGIVPPAPADQDEWSGLLVVPVGGPVAP